MHEEKQDGQDVDLLALAFSEAPALSFEFKGALFEVKPPSVQRQGAIRKAATVPVLDTNHKPLRQNGVPVTKLDNDKYTALLVIETVYYPGGERAVFADDKGKPSKAHLDRVLAMPTSVGSFLHVAQPAILKAMGVDDDAMPLEDEEEGNSDGTAASGS